MAPIALSISALIPAQLAFPDGTGAALAMLGALLFGITAVGVGLAALRGLDRPRRRSDDGAARVSTSAGRLVPRHAVAL